MEKSIKIALGLGAVALLVACSALLKTPSVVTNTIERLTEKAVDLGASSGTTHSYLESFNGGLVQGGGCMATSTAATGAIAGTLTAVQMANNSCFYIMNNKSGTLALTLPASTSMATTFLPNVGDSKTWLFNNATTSPEGTLTITAPSSIDLVAVTANDDLIDQSEFSYVTCVNVHKNANIACITSELLTAD